MGKAIYKEVEIDIDDVLEELEDDDLVEELERRGYEVAESREKKNAQPAYPDISVERCDYAGIVLSNASEGDFKMRRLIAAYLCQPWGTDIQTLLDMLAEKLVPKPKKKAI